MDMSSFTTFRREVGRRCAALRQLSVDELLALACTPPEIHQYLFWRTATIELLIEERQPGTVRVIVRGLLRNTSWWPHTWTAVEGFDKSRDGTLTDAEVDF